jgi:hypothetical protein
VDKPWPLFDGMNRGAETSLNATNDEARQQATARVINRGGALSTLRVGIQDDEQVE